MRINKTAAAILFSSLLLCFTAADMHSSADSGRYSSAVVLYNNGMYEQARNIFETMKGNPLSDGYTVLCAIKMRTSDYPELISRYEREHGGTSLTDRVRFESARLLFDEGKYGEALLEFSKVSTAALDASSELPEYMFKCGYSSFSVGRDREALQFFTILEGLDYSGYTAPGRYVSGVIHYNGSDFVSAERCFALSSSDPRFSELSKFYIVDCEFNRKNYEFVVREGEKLYPTVPKERKERLARIISESHLVLGNGESARKYYSDLSQKEMNRKDYFYAGSVLYSVHDYAGAIESYLKMGERKDSLGQIASYHLGNAYLHTNNRVAAMEAFYDASTLEYDKQITEDASFNYAKLAFDLNKDTSGFARYLKRYSTRARGEQIYSYMALASLYDRDYAAAVEAFDKIDDLDDNMRSNYIKANFLRGRQLFSNGSYRDAAPYFKSSSYYLPKTDRLNQYSRYWLAESYYRSENYPEAAKLFTELYNADALDGKQEGGLLSYNIAYSYFKQGDYDSAAKWFDSYASSSTYADYREDALTRRADCDFARHDYKAAIKAYSKVREEYFSADKIYPYYRQALSYGLSGDKKRKLSALKLVEGASVEAPLYAEAWYELGRTQMELRQYEDALESFNHLRNSAKDNVVMAKALGGLGMVSRNTSDYDKALSYYKEVVKIMPGSEYSEEALLAIESIYQAKRQPQKYLEYLEENKLNSAKTDSEKEQMYFNTAEQIFLDGNYSSAIASLEKYAENFPEGDNISLARFYMGESYRSLGEKEKALEEYSEAMKSASELSFVEMSRLRYADISYELERYGDAASAYGQLLSSAKISSNKTSARVGLLRSSFKGKDYESALTAADAVMKDSSAGTTLQREARYLKAKSYWALSRRSEAVELFRSLSSDASSPEGAEAEYLIVQNNFDTGDFDAVEREVYAFSQKAGSQSYWLARAYLVLGDSFAERGKTEQAQATYESVLNGYEPSSDGDDVPESARMRLNRLKTSNNN